MSGKKDDCRDKQGYPEMERAVTRKNTGGGSFSFALMLAFRLLKTGSFSDEKKNYHLGICFFSKQY